MKTYKPLKCKNSPCFDCPFTGVDNPSADLKLHRFAVETAPYHICHNTKDKVCVGQLLSMTAIGRESPDDRVAELQKRVTHSRKDIGLAIKKKYKHKSPIKGTKVASKFDHSNYVNFSCYGTACLEPLEDI